MKQLLFLAGFFTVVGFVCKDSGTSYEGTHLGAYKYSASDTLGTIVTTGTIAFYQKDSQLNGPWRFDDGRSGNLKGTITGAQVYIDLSPQYADNNLILRGTLAGNSFSGLWSHIGFPGELARGSFIATKQ